MLSREVPGSSLGIFKILFRPRLDRLTNVKVLISAKQTSKPEISEPVPQSLPNSSQFRDADPIPQRLTNTARSDISTSVYSDNESATSPRRTNPPSYSNNRTGLLSPRPYRTPNSTSQIRAPTTYQIQSPQYKKSPPVRVRYVTSSCWQQPVA